MNMIDICTPPCVSTIASQWEAAVQHRKFSSVLIYYDLEGQAGGSGVGGRHKREGIYLYIQLIHFLVQQKLTPHCKAINLQLKKKLQSIIQGLALVYMPRSPPITSVSSVQSLSHDRLFATPWTAACQASLSITNFQSLLKLASIELVTPSNHLILCRPLLPLTRRTFVGKAMSLLFNMLSRLVPLHKSRLKEIWVKLYNLLAGSCPKELSAMMEVSQSVVIVQLFSCD